jgi:hypothetical protein
MKYVTNVLSWSLGHVNPRDGGKQNLPRIEVHLDPECVQI